MISRLSFISGINPVDLKIYQYKLPKSNTVEKKYRKKTKLLQRCNIMEMLEEERDKRTEEM